ncbi:MAG TPA: UDP-N-acetylglucosamine 1-carboxyvinyltransferase [Thermoanaerobaculia bacterium]|nr:UDP-N-acetylglucosamine 1-carboxyvinyltransferase [Thermoanaerobaculia bacterium]
MEKFLIEGPSRLAGVVRASGAKNASLPAVAASLLTDEPLLLSGVPRVRDAHTMLALLAHLGVDGKWLDVVDGGTSLELRGCGGTPTLTAPYELVKTMRASILVLGPLLARYGQARVSLPGGCAIGVRPIDQHLAGLSAMGAEIELEHGYVEARARRLHGCDFELSTPTVTGTENLMLAATLADGTTRLRNCAREPEVSDLAELLCAMGARIEGAGTPTIEIEGRQSLAGASHAVVPDRIEVGTYLVGAAITGGDVTVEGARYEHLEALLGALHDVGAEVQRTAREIRVRSERDALRCRDVVTAPYPGFPTDLQAQFLALVTQAGGRSTICETVFENRFQHVPELCRMGASVTVDGSYARVDGPRQLEGANVMATDLRASACLVLAGLCAQGTTKVDRIYHLDRGYERMESKLQSLGARVERVR